MLLDGELEEELDPQFMKKVLHKILIYIQRVEENLWFTLVSKIKNSPKEGVSMQQSYFDLTKKRRDYVR